MTITISAFYKFVAIEDCAAVKASLSKICEVHAIKGTILLSREGINATVSGTHDNVSALLAWLRADTRFSDLASKQSYAEAHPFERMKIKIKPEIVTFGVPDIDPSYRTGNYVEPHEWNTLITDPDVIVVDTRNDYEVEIGTFERARNPRTRTFSEFPSWAKSELATEKAKKIAMFCTGGIRCEKASAFLLSEGFREVYHLRGGILKYLEAVPRQDSLWHGDCFVFDDRVALEHGMQAGQYVRCMQCGNPVVKRSAGADALPGQTSCPDCAAAVL